MLAAGHAQTHCGSEVFDQVLGAGGIHPTDANSASSWSSGSLGNSGCFAKCLHIARSSKNARSTSLQCEESLYLTLALQMFMVSFNILIIAAEIVHEVIKGCNNSFTEGPPTSLNFQSRHVTGSINLGES